MCVCVCVCVCERMCVVHVICLPEEDNGGLLKSVINRLFSVVGLTLDLRPRPLKNSSTLLRNSFVLRSMTKNKLRIER